MAVVPVLMGALLAVRAASVLDSLSFSLTPPLRSQEDKSNAAMTQRAIQLRRAFERGDVGRGVWLSKLDEVRVLILASLINPPARVCAVILSSRTLHPLECAPDGKLAGGGKLFSEAGRRSE
jgi:hypothetical protein